MGTNLGGMAAIDQSWVRPGIGKLFLVPYPTPATEVGQVTVTAGGKQYKQQQPMSAQPAARVQTSKYFSFRQAS